jgi:hypothetical protein
MTSVIDFTMTPAQWRKWADNVLSYTPEFKRMLIKAGLTQTFFGGEWGDQEGTIEERALYAYLIAEYLEDSSESSR